MKQSFKTRVGQWWVPAEFRLPEPEFTREQLDLLEELIQLIAPNISRVESATRDGLVQMANFLVDLGTGIWRIRRKIEGLSRMPREIRDALYSLESMWMSMSEGGVEIVDHIGTVPSPREAKIIETREVTGLAREQVIDTVKPTILLRGELVQLGEVIMGKPVSSASAAPFQESIAEPVPRSEQDDASAEEQEPAPPSLEVETFTMEPPLKKWESRETPEPEPEPEEITAADEDDGPRLDSETAIAMEAMESSGETVLPEILPKEPAETGEPEIEIPLPRKAPRRGKSIREAVKQVIEEEPEATAFDDTGRARRRKQRSAAAKQDSPEPESAPAPRRKRTSKKSGEEEQSIG